MPVRDWSHAEFPESTATADGIRDIDAGPVASRQVSIQLDLTYAVKDGRPLHLVVIRPALDWATADIPLVDTDVFPLIVFVQRSAWREQQLGRHQGPPGPVQQSLLMYQALRRAGQPVEMARVRGAAHGGPTFWTDELLDLVHEFLSRHLTGPQPR